jgi:hypothetical protein
MREAFEKSLQKVGGDILTANAIWSRYRTFEMDETQDIIDMTTGSSYFNNLHGIML